MRSLRRVTAVGAASAMVVAAVSTAVLGSAGVAHADTAAAVGCSVFHPQLSLVKSANVTKTQGNGLIVYTLKYTVCGGSQNGNGRNVVVTDQVPGSTTFVSCTGGCVESGNPAVATWTFPVVPADTTGTVTFTVRVGLHICSGNIVNQASAKADNTLPMSVVSNIVTIPVTGGAPVDMSTANASGSAYPLGGTVLGSAFGPFETVSSNRTGLGTDGPNKSSAPGVSIPNIVTVGLLSAQSTSTVTSVAATDESSATVASINLLNGLVTATLLKADARAQATPVDAKYSATGSEIDGLVINGAPVQAIFPNETFNLLNGTVKVVLLEETASTSSTGGVNRADISVNLIHVTVGGLLGPTVDLIVGHAQAHASAPAQICVPTRTVSAEAFAARVGQSFAPNLLAPVTVNDIAIAPTGGSDSVAARSFTIGDGGSTIGSGTVTEAVNGSLTPAPNSSANATVQTLCLFTGVPCTPGVTPSTGIVATLVEANTTSSANGTTAASSPLGSKIGTLTIAGQTINVLNVPANTIISIPGIAAITLNEQIKEADSNGTTNTGLTVNMIHIRLLADNVDVIISSAHSDAHWS